MGLAVTHAMNASGGQFVGGSIVLVRIEGDADPGSSGHMIQARS